MSASRKHKVKWLHFFLQDYSSGDTFTHDLYIDWCDRRGFTPLTKMEFAHWIRRIVRAQVSLGWQGWMTPYARIESWPQNETVFSQDLSHLSESGRYTENPVGKREYTVYRIASRPKRGTREWYEWKNSTL